MNYFRWLIYLMLWFATVSALAESPVFSKVTQGRALSFPRDFGAHPDFKTEWSGGTPLAGYKRRRVNRLDFK